jgi:hypothetical protein
MPGIVRVLGDGGLGLASVKDVRVGLVSRAVWHQLGWCGLGDTGSGFASAESKRLELASMLWCVIDRD